MLPLKTGFYEDGRAAYGWLKSQKIKEEKIVLYGESLGTGIAVHLAYKGMGTALILETPFSSLPEAAQSHYPFFPANWIVKDKFDPLLKKSEVWSSHSDRAWKKGLCDSIPFGC